METFNGLTFRTLLDWFVCLMLILTVLQSKVIAPPIASSKATAFLEKFGYMREGSRDSFVISMRSTKNAVLAYQEFMGLNETGELDDATLTMMSKPRCGEKDRFDDDILTRRKRYAWEGSKWAFDTVSYSITKYPKRIKDQRMVDREFERAFRVWRYQTPLNFNQLKNREADIEIRFEERHHGHANAFDGPGWTLAHATPPKTNAYIHFDDEEEWTIDEYSGINLFQMAVHEIGHSLGLIHSQSGDTLMFPNYNETEGPHVALKQDDINGVQYIYGDAPKRSFCEGPLGFIDAVTTTEDGKTYIFRGKYYWEVVRGNNKITRPVGNGTFPRSIDDDWVGLAIEDDVSKSENDRIGETSSTLRGHLDAALTWPDGHTFFFKRDKYWRFRNKVMDPGYPKLISEGFEGIPVNIDAAFMWNNRTFFCKGSNFWEYDCEKTPPVSSEYPQPINNLQGVPDYIDAALQFTDQRTYLFKDHEFYTLHKETFTVSRGASLITAYWYDCS